jgi:hypothetical protein
LIGEKGKVLMSGYLERLRSGGLLASWQKVFVLLTKSKLKYFSEQGPNERIL